MNNEQVDFNETEQKDIEQSQREKMLWLGDPNLSWKRRFFQMIATVVSFLLFKFGTSLKWQFWLCVYLGITCPVGTWTSIKWFINLIF